MFNFEKVFQNDDLFLINLSNIFKTIIIFFTTYIFSILNKNSIYDILNYQLYLNSEFFFYGTFQSFIFFTLSFINQSKFYDEKNLIFLKKDFFYFSLIIILNLFVSFIADFKKILLTDFILLNLLILLNIFLSKKIFDLIYLTLIKNNIIQRNILIIGKFNDVINILKEKKQKKNIYKCCVLLDEKKIIKPLSYQIKIPIFSIDDDPRLILEYHELGQIWFLSNSLDYKKNSYFKKIINYPVDILIADLNHKKYNYDELKVNNYKTYTYEISKFYGTNLFFKIFFDKILSTLFLIFFSPLIFFFGALIYIEDGFPIIFKQQRTGLNGRRFLVYKLRTLKNQKNDPSIQVTKNDNRILKIGRFIRKYSIDELPQFFNVLMGNMSIVGPRPHPVTLDLKYLKLYEAFLNRYKSVPGLTGWAQINGLRGLTENPEDMRKRMEFDLWYLKNWSLSLDFYIIFRSFYAVFKYKGD